MNWFSRLRRSLAVKLTAAGNSSGPAPVPLSLAFDGTNPIHQLLDDTGLPWLERRRDLEARIGITEDPFYRNPALFFAGAVPPPGFLQPWQAAVFERYTPDMPVVRFTGLTWFADDAATNIERTAEFFAARLGPAPIEEGYNTLICRWQAGSASLQLVCWPPALQSPGRPNDAYAREPRLVTACHVTLLTGFRLPLSAEEKAWVEAFRPIADTRSVLALTAERLIAWAPNDTEVEYARDPAGYLSNVLHSVGCPPGCEALILCTNQLFVLPANDVLGFEVLRMLPAKGGGGSTLLVRCRTSCKGVAYKTLIVARHGDPDGMVPLGRELADLFNKPCEVSRYFDDA